MQCTSCWRVRFVLIRPVIAPSLPVATAWITNSMRFCMKSDTQSPLVIPAAFSVFAIRFARSFNVCQVTTSSSHISAIALGILAALPSTSNENEAIWLGAGGLVVAATNRTFKSPIKLVIAPIVIVPFRNFCVCS